MLSGRSRGGPGRRTEDSLRFERPERPPVRAGAMSTVGTASEPQDHGTVDQAVKERRR